jgi:hypothetical protein
VFKIIYKTELLYRRCTTAGIPGGQKVVECCKSTTVCEVDSGVLTGMTGYILYLVCYMER